MFVEYIILHFMGYRKPCFGENNFNLNCLYFIILLYDMLFNNCKQIIHENSLEMT